MGESALAATAPAARRPPTGGTDWLGICITAEQWGHLPFWPALAAGIRSSFRQLGQGNSSGSSLGGSLPAGGAVDARGICKTAPHWGHCPFFPAVSSGVRTSQIRRAAWRGRGEISVG